MGPPNGVRVPKAGEGLRLRPSLPRQVWKRKGKPANDAEKERPVKQEETEGSNPDANWRRYFKEIVGNSVK